MTITSPTAFGQFGYTLAFAQRALTASLQRQLAEIDTAPETWYALKLIATRGPALARGSLTEALDGSQSMTPERTRELLTHLEVDGLIRGQNLINEHRDRAQLRLGAFRVVVLRRHSIDQCLAHHPPVNAKLRGNSRYRADTKFMLPT